jgi:hypothetical protein
MVSIRANTIATTRNSIVCRSNQSTTVVGSVDVAATYKPIPNCRRVVISLGDCELRPGADDLTRSCATHRSINQSINLTCSDIGSAYEKDVCSHQQKWIALSSCIEEHKRLAIQTTPNACIRISSDSNHTMLSRCRCRAVYCAHTKLYKTSSATNWKMNSTSRGQYSWNSTPGAMMSCMHQYRSCGCVCCQPLETAQCVRVCASHTLLLDPRQYGKSQVPRVEILHSRWSMPSGTAVETEQRDILSARTGREACLETHPRPSTRWHLVSATPGTPPPTPPRPSTETP